MHFTWICLPVSNSSLQTAPSSAAHVSGLTGFWCWAGDRIVRSWLCIRPIIFGFIASTVLIRWPVIGDVINWQCGIRRIAVNSHRVMVTDGSFVAWRRNIICLTCTSFARRTSAVVDHMQVTEHQVLCLALWFLGLVATQRLIAAEERSCGKRVSRRSSSWEVVSSLLYTGRCWPTSKHV